MSELAQELIRKEKEERTGKLDLGNCGLTDFPEELFELEWLEELNFCSAYRNLELGKWNQSPNNGGKNLINQTKLPEAFTRFNQLRTLLIGGFWFWESWKINDCSVLEELNSLTYLNLSYNQISDIHFLGKLKNVTCLDLSFNQISDISILENLKGMTRLYFSYNQISDIHFLGKLKNLTCLDLSSNQINDISILEDLTSLTNLDLRSNQISDISILENLTSLTSLNLCSNQISDISILKNLKGLFRLYLSGNQISDYSFLEKLTGLTSLGLGNNKISDISILEKLTNLTSLDLGNNKISDISILENLTSLTSLDLPSNQISDISILENLTSLTSLYLSSNQISDISILDKLTNLTTLSLNRNQISDISILDKLTSLTTLSLSRNQISDISILDKLTSLTTLDLSRNQISDISILDKLTSLNTLDLGYNQISDIKWLIPLLQKGVPVNLEEYAEEGISLYKNPIIEPPLEIVKQGRESILDWFEAKKRKLNEIKIILLGDPKAGKTSLFKRLKYNTFNPNEVQTDGVNIEDIDFSACETFMLQKSLHDITGHFWDFGGQEIMNATHQFFLTKRAVYVLVLDARKDANNSSQVRQWVKRIRVTGDDSPIIVLANQIDVNSGFGFENERELQNEFPQIKFFLKVSCNTNENIELLRDKLEEIIPTAELFNTEIDEKWIAVKNVLEKETKAGDYLNEKRFVSICNDVFLTEKQKQNNAITFLHDLGLVLHFDDLNLAEYYVLDPYWITYGVYQILTSAYAGKMKGRVGMDQLDFIVNKEEDKKEIYNPANYKKIEYSTNERRFLIDILNQFKLCFCSDDHSEFIIPDLLDTAEPLEIVESIRTSSEHIQFVYKYEYLPKFVIPNIMVEMHKLIKCMWRTGCVLQKDGCQALITNYQNRISIVVTGEYKKKREFMSVIRFIINSINEKLSDKPVALIPLPGVNAFADYERLLLREKKGKKEYIHDEDLPTERKFPISELLEGIPDDEEVRNSGKDFKEVIDRLDDLKCGINEISAKLDSHYEYLINLPDNSEIKESIDEVMQELNAQQTAEIMDWVSKVFVEFDNDMDYRLKEIYNDLKKTDDIKAKLKLSIPFINMLGINLETEFDVKSWANKMYEKHEFKLFRLMY
jgi:internalin A